ncbi:dihydroxyacetone kinase subunit DhaL [Brevibacillus nitrificans]|uniref:dihydroxyacetone kinase subunit DhaL n=1 Tax=Brevibacillus nitrificans TaxID=651560 RepID=UPI0028575D96|nr:dihydroxyacetone kinase subunit DhaL [Brevibacillus nitrificans]MDR7315462.1 dihydroxyacetone kinase-like protein [Brevibacillus nitrificans]
MREALGFEDVQAILQAVGKRMDENKDFLCQLDGALGDGDIGLTMSNGFRAVNDQLRTSAGGDIGKALMSAALEMGEAVASTMGTLMSSALFRAGKAIQGKTELTTVDVIAFFQAIVQGLKERGRANVGDKTILDSLVPAVDAMEVSHSEGKSLGEIMLVASEAADKGAKETIEMQSRHGRAARYLERSIGHQDPGAAVGALLVKGFSDGVTARLGSVE